ncbi:hypothetical protein H310_12639 [Aphanomyces invadans]|uniref:Uncharacterized protein n=1 Tax=Aphanomyces invadans TaxID=157072 RepID=A0A024TJ83_9STRA|nr:hypothetical protein H310_12639 [Aphanomyces invadans]ETV93377.1 hypothetical protein H310_12639 [Aphanomyces invadans]|eukprot:XP_008878013.1 hypothetical protein H310_12639 [Aphanomyces invadans]
MATILPNLQGRHISMWGMPLASSTTAPAGGRQAKKKKRPTELPASEVERKAALYNVGCPKSFPSTRKCKPRHRLALHQLVQEDANGADASDMPQPPFQGRPPAGHVGFVQDLQTTVPDRHRVPTRGDWKLGRNNSASSFKLSASGIDGLLEPSDAAREVVAATCPTAEFRNLLLAYPPADVNHVAKALASPAQDWVKPRVSRPCDSYHNSDCPGGWPKGSTDNNHAADAPDPETPWVPPNSPHRTDPAKSKHARSSLNPTALRDAQGSARPPYVLPTRTVDTLLRRAQSAERGHNAVRARIHWHKNPAHMYSLPVASPSRSCRLGLDALASDPSIDAQHKPRSTTTRPKSAVHLMKHAIQVAGAKLRPKTARMSYLKTATVYCVDTPETNTMEEYARKIQAEKDRRKNVVHRKQAMHRIVRYNSITERSVEYIFHCLRHQAIENVPVHLRPTYESIDVDEYMRLVHLDDDDRPFLNAQPNGYDAGWDRTALGVLWVRRSRVGAARVGWFHRSIQVDRAQFTKAVQCLKMTATDVNVLFNVLDFDLDHKIEIGQVCREIRTLQMAKVKKHVPDLMLGGHRTKLRDT